MPREMTSVAIKTHVLPALKSSTAFSRYGPKDMWRLVDEKKRGKYFLFFKPERGSAKLNSKLVPNMTSNYSIHSYRVKLIALHKKYKVYIQ